LSYATVREGPYQQNSRFAKTVLAGNKNPIDPPNPAENGSQALVAAVIACRYFFQSCKPAINF